MRHRGVHRHGELGRDPPSRPRRRPEPTRRLPRVRHPLEDPREDPHPRRAARLSPRRAPAALDPRPAPAGRPPDPPGRQEGPEEAAAHRRADLPAAPRRARLRRRPDRRQGRRPRLEAPRTPRSSSRWPTRRARPRSTSARPRSSSTAGRPRWRVFVMTLPYSDAMFCLRLPARVHRGVPRGARPRLRLLRRRPAPHQLRQPQDRRRQDHRRPGAEGHRRVPPAPEPPPLRGALLPGAAAQREGARRDARRLRPPQLPRARPRACTAAWRGSTPGSRPTAAPTWRGGCGASRRPRPSCWPRSGRRCCRCRPRRSRRRGSSSRTPTRCRWSGSTPTTTRCRRSSPTAGSPPSGRSTSVRIAVGDRVVATHRRCWGREGVIYDPVHYLALLERKPGALDFARAAGGLGAAGLLRRPAPAAGGRVRRAGDAAVHQGPAAAGAGEPRRS